LETDMTVQAFSQWLTEMKARSSRTLHENLSEMSIIRDGITSNNMELTDFKRHSTGISQQMQSQLTDLREKLTNAFGEITTLVKQKTQSDQEMMQDINCLQQNLSCKTSEMDALKRSYSQVHAQLQSSLIQIQNQLSVTNSEVQSARSSCDRVQRETQNRFTEIDSNLRALEDELSVGNAENRNQMLQLQEEIARIHESLASVSAEFLDHKRATNSVHNKLQSQVWSLEEGRKRQQQADQPAVMPSRIRPAQSVEAETVQACSSTVQFPTEPSVGAVAAAAPLPSPATAGAGYANYAMLQPAGMNSAATQPGVQTTTTQPQLRPPMTGSQHQVQALPLPPITKTTVITPALPGRSSVVTSYAGQQAFRPMQR